jgi:hypothetical protein
MGSPSRIDSRFFDSDRNKRARNAGLAEAPKQRATQIPQPVTSAK